MPYIKKTDRIRLDHDLDEIETRSVGELNYCITRLMHKYLEGTGSCFSGVLTYQALNEVLGAVEAAKLELYRRVAAPYEEKKLDANGDVSPKVS